MILKNSVFVIILLIIVLMPSIVSAEESLKFFGLISGQTKEEAIDAAMQNGIQFNDFNSHGIARSKDFFLTTSYNHTGGKWEEKVHIFIAEQSDIIVAVTCSFNDSSSMIEFGTNAWISYYTDFMKQLLGEPDHCFFKASLYEDKYFMMPEENDELFHAPNFKNIVLLNQETKIYYCWNNIILTMKIYENKKHYYTEVQFSINRSSLDYEKITLEKYPNPTPFS